MNLWKIYSEGDDGFEQFDGHEGVNGEVDKAGKNLYTHNQNFLIHPKPYKFIKKP